MKQRMGELTAETKRMTDKEIGWKPGRSFALWVIAIFAVVAAGGGTLLLTLNRWNPPDRANQLKNPEAPTDESVAAGKQVFGDHCISCHGVKGDGHGERAEKLSVAPADLTNAMTVGHETDGMLFWKISEGHRPMPAYKNRLTQKERWELVNYIRSFGKG